jgi:hypothetical protein
MSFRIQEIATNCSDSCADLCHLSGISPINFGTDVIIEEARNILLHSNYYRGSFFRFLGCNVGCWDTRHANISLDIIAHNQRRAASRASNVDVLKMNATASGSWGARQIRHNTSLLSTAGAVNVDELDIGDVDLRRGRFADSGVDIEVALVEYNRVIGVLDVDILVGNVADISVAGCRACPGLQAGAVLAVEKSDVLDPGIGDEVFDAGVLADGTHADTMCAVAPKVLDKDVGRVWLRAEAVVTHVDAGVGYGQTVHIQGVKAVGVLWKRLLLKTLVTEI